jgi:CarD family transcriptional regulator
MYPRHGAAVIEDLVEQDASGESRQYFKLRPMQGNIVIMLPVDSVKRVGLRSVVTRRNVAKVFDLLRQEQGSMPMLWSQRYKINMTRLASGDIYQLAELVRDLSLLGNGKTLSSAEARMLAKARGDLIMELTLAAASSEAKTVAMLDEALEGARSVTVG